MNSKRIILVILEFQLIHIGFESFVDHTGCLAEEGDLGLKDRIVLSLRTLGSIIHRYYAIYLFIPGSYRSQSVRDVRNGDVPFA